MALTLAKTALKSRKIRRDVTGTGSGLRRIQFDTTLPGVEGSGGWISGLLDFGKRLFGRGFGFIKWLVSSIASFNFSAVQSAIMSSLEELSQFNWNITDEEIKQQIKALNDETWGVWGDLVGQGLGWVSSIVIGAGVSVAIPVIGGRALLAAVAGKVGSEAVQELAAGLKGAVQQQIDIEKRKKILQTYMNIRSFLKSKDLGGLIGPEAAKWVKDKWGVKGQPEITFVKKRDEAINKIKHTGHKQFVENLIDGWWESLNQGTVIVAQELDDAWQAAVAAQRQALGEPRAIEIQPDDRNPDEKMLLSGTERSLVPAIFTTLNIHKSIHNRDVGQVGAVLPEGIWIPEYARRRLTLVFFSVPRPPWKTADGLRPRKAEYNIPNPRPGLTWQQIKTACGGANGYTWGEWYAVGRTAARRKMVVYASTEAGAVVQLESLASLSADNLLTVRTGRMARALKPEMRKRSTQMYPAYLWSAKLTMTAAEERRFNLEGQQYAEERTKILLWTEEAPFNADQIFS